MHFQFQFASVFAESDFILQGMLLTIYLSAGAILFGSIIAILLSAARSNGPRGVGIAVDAYVELVRNTPFLVQLFIIFFGLPSLGMRLNANQAALLAMTLNLAAYSTEIIRAGVESIHRSQIEAGLSLAMTKRQIFQHVVIVPAIAKVWPALSSQFVLMLLASSICSFISVQELSGATAIIEQRTFRSFETYIVATLLYLVMALVLKTALLGLGRLLFPRVSGLSRVQVKGEAA
ncbi:amino acid ABC transporter permease [Chelatococcus sp. GCM10030263]|uniref:amino acid ABC transporter permease n=1 Tax=Chelatococcus sp. GCM10030263 TaxID=3273387 RepID=UPI003612AE12